MKNIFFSKKEGRLNFAPIFYSPSVFDERSTRDGSTSGACSLLAAAAAAAAAVGGGECGSRGCLRWPHLTAGAEAPTARPHRYLHLHVHACEVKKKKVSSNINFVVLNQL